MACMSSPSTTSTPRAPIRSSSSPARPAEQYAAKSLDDALKNGSTMVSTMAMRWFEHPGIEVIIEATGDPGAGIPLRAQGHRQRQAHRHGQCRGRCGGGPLLNKRAKQAGVVYSLAWGDQPALIADHVDWARATGFKVVCAGKGTRYMPAYHQSTPETVWDILDKYMKIRDRQSINPKMFNFLRRWHQVRHRDDGGVNATGLESRRTACPSRRRRASSMPKICKPKADGGVIERKGVTEVTSSVYRDGTDVQAQPRHGHLCRDRERERIHAGVLPRVFDAARQHRTLCPRSIARRT